MSFENLPLVIWPEKDGEYKLAQFYLGDERPFLMFTPKPRSEADDFHAFILRRFAKEAEIGYTQRGITYIFTDPNHRMVGAGLCNLDLANRIATFSGRSNDYKLGIELGHLDRLAKNFIDWRISCAQ